MTTGDTAISDIPEAADDFSIPSANETSRAVLVLGMHRSGTSALARVLNLMGVELGADLLPPAADNESGFWEHRQIQFIHDRVYEVLKLDWTNVSALAPGWWERAEIEPYRQQLREVLQRDFGNRKLWGIKDPRLCAMLPLWRPLLEEMHVQPVCVMISRNPAEVAQSLGKRDGLSTARVYLLWLRSIIDCERGSRGLPRALATFEQILSGWSTQVDRMAVALNLTWPRSTSEVAAEVADFIRPSSRHHHVDDQQFLIGQAVPEIVRRLHVAVLQAADAGDLSLLSNVVDEVAFQLDSSQPLLTEFIADLEQEHRNKVIEKNVESIRLNGEIGLMHHSVAAHVALLSERDRQVAAISQQLAEHIDLLQHERDAAAAFAVKVAEERNIAAHDRLVANESIGSLENQIAVLNSQLSASATETAAWREHAAQLVLSIEAYKQQLQSEQASHTFTKNELGAYQVQRMVLMRVLEKLQATRAWRWSTRLRDWDREPLLREDLVPISALRGIGTHRWACDGPAQFVLPCLPLIGKIRVEIKLDVSVRGHARLYYDTGSLFNVNELIDLGPVENETIIEREATLSRPVHCFRFDPLDCSGEFTLLDFKIFCISK